MASGTTAQSTPSVEQQKREAQFYPFLNSFTLTTVSKSSTGHEESVSIYGIHGGTGPPLLLLHGFPQTHLIWHKAAKELTTDFSLIIPDLRGYGDSSKPSSSPEPNDHSLYSKAVMAADCVSVMTQLGYPEFFVCGHDRGGRVAHKMCVDFPAKVKKVIFLDIIPTKAMYAATSPRTAHAYWHWFFLTQPAPFPENAILAAPEVFAEKCLVRPGLEREKVFGEAYACYERGFGDEGCVRGMCEDYRAAREVDVREQEADEREGRRVRCPVRVLWGRQGVLEGMNVMGEWERASEQGWVDRGGSEALDCGHFIPEEEPENVVRCVREFFR